MESIVFDSLNALNVNDHTEKKKVGDKELTYLSWPWAWAEVKKRFPDASYTIWKNAAGLPYTVDPMTGFMVYTSVTIEGVTHEMWLPVMDGANRAMKPTEYDYTVKNPSFRYASWNADLKGYYDRYGKEQPEFLTKHVEAASMMDINKAIMRCLVKNLAMFGLGLYIYAGEDLPESEDKVPELPKETTSQKPQNKQEGASTVQAKAEVTTTQKVPEMAQNVTVLKAWLEKFTADYKDDEKHTRLYQMLNVLRTQKKISDKKLSALSVPEVNSLFERIYAAFPAEEIA